MPIYDIQHPNGKIYSIEAGPDANEQDLFNVVEQYIKNEEETPGMGEALVGGGKRLLSQSLTSLQTPFLGAEEAAARGLTRQKDITERSAVDLDKVIKAYAQSGLLGAGKEVGSQILPGLAEQAPLLAANIAASRAAMAVTPPVLPGVGPFAKPIAGLAGFAAPTALQIFGGETERQQGLREEAIKKGETPKDISVGKALVSTAGQVGLETLGNIFVFGKPIFQAALGKINADRIFNLFSTGSIEAAEKLAKESVTKAIAKGTIKGVAAEGGTEAAQALLSRWQAGLPLLNEEAFGEYANSLYGGAIVGGPLGGATRPFGRKGAAQKADALRQEQFDRDRRAAAEEADRIRAALLGDQATKTTLALPAPAETVLENANEADETVLTIKPTELTPEVRGYVEEARARLNLPKLKSYTIEDLQDAMPGIDPEGERAVLNSILASKTGFDRFISEGIKPTRALVLKEAANKNIDTQSQGFNDFLKRTTGQSDLAQMNPVELYTAYSALQNMGRMEGEGAQLLPEGSNASRFTQQQYNTAVKFVKLTLDQLKINSLNVQDVVQEIRDATGLESDRDVETLLNTALRSGDLEQKPRKVYRIVDKNTGESLSGPLDKEAVAIQRANNTKNGVIKTEQFYEIGLPEKVSPRKDMPDGYNIVESEVADTEVPAGYEIVQEGKTRPLATKANEEDAQRQLDRIAKRNERRTNSLNKKIQGQQGRIAKAQEVVDNLAARGMGDTQQAKVAQTKLEADTRDAEAQIAKFQAEIDEISQPISLRPTQAKLKKGRQRFILRKNGKDLGAFPTQEAASQAMLANMSNAELDAFEDRMAQQEAAGIPRPAMSAKATRERASRRKPGIEVRTSEKAAPQETEPQRKARLKRAVEKFASLGIDARERQEVLNELRDRLRPLLDKLGLKNVGLNVVSGLENGAGGKYDAAKRTISIALDEENPVQTLRHEVIHALKNLGFFTKSQWAVLERRAKTEWVEKYLKGSKVEFNGRVMTRYDAYKNELKLSEAEIIEEAIADAFGDFDANRPPPGMMAALLKKMKGFFSALRSALNGTGFTTADQIFTKADLGELTKSENQSKKLISPNQSRLNRLIDDIKLNIELAKQKREFNKYKKQSAQRSQELNDLYESVKKANEELRAKNLPDKEREAQFDAILDSYEQKSAAIFRKYGSSEESLQSLFRNGPNNAWQSTQEERDAAFSLSRTEDILPYVSEGYLDVPIETAKFSLQKYNPDKHLRLDPALGLPINKNGTVTLYYHTTKAEALAINRDKKIPANGRNRIYLTNESNGAEGLRNPGNFDQDIDGSTVLIYATPDMLQVDETYDNGRVDVYIPVAQGDFFNKKMKLQSIQKGRQEAISQDFNYNEHEKKISNAINKYKNAEPKERRKMVADARKKLKAEHNVSTLLTENGKLEKTRIGDYGLDYDGDSVASLGLGLASAQKITDKLSTCPNSAICEGLCLGETSGGNLMFGGAAMEDVKDIQKSAFRAGPRMMQYLKTEALIVNPEAFVIKLQAEIDNFSKWARSTTETKRDNETKKSVKVEKDQYAPAIRLNVTSDFRPQMFSGLIEANPDVMFYDYTKLGNDPIAPNHHLTYSSTGFGQLVDGKKITNKYHNWETMRRRLNNGQNVAMAFSSKKAIPKYLVDEETQTQYVVWDGDEYDARFLDPKQENGLGVIVGLRNKAGNLTEKNATEKTEGFFIQYEPSADGDTVVVRDQAQFKPNKTVTVLKPGEKLSLKTYFESAKEAESAVEEAGVPDTKEFKLFYGNSKLRTDDGEPLPMYHGASAVIDVFRDDKPIFVSPTARFAEDFAVVRSDETGLTPKIYPVWVRTETTFDYGNPEHRADVIAEVISNRRKPDEPVRERPVYLERSKQWKSIEDIDEDLSNGMWSTIEDPAIQRAIRKLGYDGFIVREAGQDNLAVFSPNQLKSITGNEGQFSLGDPDIKYSLGKTIKDSPEFKNWFKQSKAVDANGNPIVLYHGTKADITEFWTNLNIGRNKFYGGELGAWFGSEADVANLFAEKKGSGASVYPVYLSLQKPYVFDDYREFNRFVEGRKSAAAVRRELQKEGYDGVIIRDSITDTGTKRDDYVAFKPEQIKSVFNTGTFDPKNPDIRYSLSKKVPKAAPTDTKMMDRINATTTRRSPEKMGEFLTQAFMPKAFSVIRQQLLNRYNRLSEYDRALEAKRTEEMGMDVTLMADQSAEAMALLSDLGSGVLASAFGIKGRTGGHVVYEDGVITIDRNTKGMAEILAPLGAYKDPEVFQKYQYWAGVKRGVRLMGEGREKLFNQEDVAYAAQLEKQYPEFVQVQKDFAAFNDSLVNVMLKTGVIDKAQAKAWVEHADYVPFYRQMEEGDKTIGPNVFQSISTVRQPKKLKGGEAPLADFFESIVRNTKAAIESSMKNNAARVAINNAVELGLAERLNVQESKTARGPDIVRIFEDGKQVSYRVADKLFVDSISSLHMADIPFLGMVSAPSNLLRNLVTKEPGFMLANLLRDSLSAYTLSGQKMTPIIGSAVSFGKAIINKNPTVETLLDLGVTGGYEFSANVIDSGRMFERDIERKAGKGSKPLRLATGAWDALEKGTTASDAATRALVFDRVFAETGNKVEAAYRALEVMNFNRKGANVAVRIVTAGAPFLNARMQGLDLFYRVGISPWFSRRIHGRTASAAQKERQKIFFVRGGTIMALSALYYAAVAGTDEYEKQEEETRDNNWIVGGYKIPIPFEVGVLFKTIPERIMRWAFGTDTGKDFAKAMQRAIISTFAFNPMPQTIRPIYEVAADHSFFTGRPIISESMKDVAPEYQVNPGTTKGAQILGKALGYSPIKIDHLWKGYTGTMGMYLADVVDSVLDLFEDSPKPTRRLEQLPVIRRFLADPEARGRLTQFYELKRAVDVFVRTSNLLDTTFKPEERLKYIKENYGLWLVQETVRDMDKALSESNKMRQEIINSKLSGDEKRDKLLRIDRYQNKIVEQIQVLKQIASRKRK